MNECRLIANFIQDNDKQHLSQSKNNFSDMNIMTTFIPMKNKFSDTIIVI